MIISALSVLPSNYTSQRTATQTANQRCVTPARDTSPSNQEKCWFLTTPFLHRCRTTEGASVRSGAELSELTPPHTAPWVTFPYLVEFDSWLRVGVHPAEAIKKQKQKKKTMPVRTERCLASAAACVSSASLVPPPPINTQQPGVATSLLYSGSQFRGHQKSKGNSYDVDVVLQVTVATVFTSHVL